MSSPVAAHDASVSNRPFSWRFTTPLFIGSALNPINSSMIATALVRDCLINGGSGLA